MLGLGSSFITSKNRIPHIVIDEDFASGTAGFTGTNANLSNASGTLEVDATASTGFAYKQFTVSNNTTYTYSIYLSSVELGSGAGHIFLGTSNGGTQYKNIDATGVATYTGTFTTTTTTLYLSLVTDNNGKYTRWDDILIQEDN